MNSDSRFWAKVDCSGGETACWPWVGSIDPARGYGRVRRDKKIGKAHRLAFTLARGPIPSGALVRHLCAERTTAPLAGGFVGQRRCCNPAHLETGTYLENAADALRAGTTQATRARGERHGFRLNPDAAARGDRNAATKLTADRVRAIRARHEAGDSIRTIARDEGVTRRSIRLVLIGETGRHVA